MMVNFETILDCQIYCVFCRKGPYRNLNALSSHRRSCAKYRTLNNMGPVPDNFGVSRNWAKGLKYGDHPGLDSFIDRGRAYHAKHGNPLLNWLINNQVPEEVYIKQSATRRKNYQSGSLRPAFGVGFGKYSYFRFKTGEEIFFRGTYEAVFAFWLTYHNISFTYEKFRASYDGITKFCDFEINNKLYEIKGPTDDYGDLVRVFQSSYYIIKIVDWRFIEAARKFLIRKGFDMLQFVADIAKGHDSKNYITLDAITLTWSAK
jgi:hypothetical protein